MSQTVSRRVAVIVVVALIALMVLVATTAVSAKVGVSGSGGKGKPTATCAQYKDPGSGTEERNCFKPRGGA